jgi:hypothetical protein
MYFRDDNHEGLPGVQSDSEARSPFAGRLSVTIFSKGDLRKVSNFEH